MTVKWDETKLQGELRVKSSELLGRVARRIEERVKVAINELDLIDTGFMVNSVYSATDEQSGYDQTDATGRYPNREGQEVWRERTDEIVPGAGEAVVHVAAEYFIEWELRLGILYGAVVATADELKGK